MALFMDSNDKLRTVVVITLNDFNPQVDSVFDVDNDELFTGPPLDFDVFTFNEVSFCVALGVFPDNLFVKTNPGMVKKEYFINWSPLLKLTGGTTGGVFKQDIP